MLDGVRIGGPNHTGHNNKDVQRATSVAKQRYTSSLSFGGDAAGKIPGIDYNYYSRATRPSILHATLTLIHPAVNVHNVDCGVDGRVDGNGNVDGNCKPPGLLPRETLASGRKHAAPVAGVSGSVKQITEPPEEKRRTGGLP